MSYLPVKKPNRHDEKLFGGFGIFPFSLVMLLVFIAAFATTGGPGCTRGLPGLYPARIARDMPFALSDDAVSVAVSHDGAFYFNTGKVTEQELRNDILVAVKRSGEQRIYLTVDEHAPYGDVKRAMNIIRSAGIENISFITK